MKKIFFLYFVLSANSFAGVWNLELLHGEDMEVQRVYHVGFEEFKPIIPKSPWACQVSEIEEDDNFYIRSISCKHLKNGIKMNNYLFCLKENDERYSGHILIDEKGKRIGIYLWCDTHKERAPIVRKS